MMGVGLDRLEILVSPLTHNIYAGYRNKNGTSTNKVDVTKAVIAAVMQHMDKGPIEEYECAVGTLKFVRK
jgi:hypothetical protein